MAGKGGYKGGGDLCPPPLDFEAKNVPLRKVKFLSRWTRVLQARANTGLNKGGGRKNLSECSTQSVK